MYGALPFTGAPLVYAAMAFGFLVVGSIARGVDFVRRRK